MSDDPRTRKLAWVRGKAKAFDGRWYPVDVVLIGPRSVRIISIAGEVSRDLRIKLRCTLQRGDRSGQKLFNWLECAGYTNLTLDVDFLADTELEEDHESRKR